MFLATLVQAVAPAENTLDPERWVACHGDVLYRYALVRLHEPERAENLVQETLLAALEGQGSFTGRSSERTWLVGILKHKIIDEYRRSARESAASDPEAVEAPGGEGSAFDERGHWRVGPAPWRRAPDQALESAQLGQVIERCLRGLSPRLARAFALRELDELETEEICKILAVSKTNLGVMLYRARSRLRDCLERTWFAEET